MKALLIAAFVTGVAAVLAWANRRPIERTRMEVADLITRQLTGAADDSAWDDFVSIRIRDSKLENIRRQCFEANLSPKAEFEETLRKALDSLENPE